MSIELETCHFLEVNSDNSAMLENNLEGYQKAIELSCDKLGEFACKVTSYRKSVSNDDD